MQFLRCCRQWYFFAFIGIQKDKYKWFSIQAFRSLNRKKWQETIKATHSTTVEQKGTRIYNAKRNESSNKSSTNNNNNNNERTHKSGTFEVQTEYNKKKKIIWSHTIQKPNEWEEEKKNTNDISTWIWVMPFKNFNTHCPFFTQSRCTIVCLLEMLDFFFSFGFLIKENPK